MPGITIRLGRRTGREGQVIWLEGEELVLGRSKSCELSLLNDAVSRRHCVITFANGNWTIQDLESQNGLFVNKRQVSRAEVRAGDDLLLGNAGPHLEILALNPAPGQAHEDELPTRALDASRVSQPEFDIPTLAPESSVEDLPADQDETRVAEELAVAEPLPDPSEEPPTREATTQERMIGQKPPAFDLTDVPQTGSPRAYEPEPKTPTTTPFAKPLSGPLEPEATDRADAPTPPASDTSPRPRPRTQPQQSPKPPRPRAEPRPKPVSPAPPKRRRRGALVVVLVILSIGAAAFLLREHWVPWFAGRFIAGRDEARVEEATAGGGFRFLRLTITSYSRKGKQKGDALDTVTTTSLLPVRVTATRTAEQALKEAQARLEERGPLQVDIAAWLESGSGDELVIAHTLKLDPGPRLERLDPDSFEATERVVTPENGPRW